MESIGNMIVFWKGHINISKIRNENQLLAKIEVYIVGVS